LKQTRLLFPQFLTTATEHFPMKKSTSLQRCLIPAVILILMSLELQAQERSPELQSAFDIQGEYVGRIVLPNFPSKSGFQVVATSETTFDAYLLDGGLPGAGWDRQGRTLLKGHGYGNASFESPELPVTFKYLRPYKDVIFVYRENYRIGTFRKVHRESPTMQLQPPENAMVLFNGRDKPRLKNARVNSNGTLGIGSETVDRVHNVRLHVEFKTPFDPMKNGQARGNSGVYIQRRYEVQILDSFGLDLEPNRCGGLYRQKSADINMALPPESWQTYDIYFYAAKFDDQGKRVKKARITVVHNGVKIHDNYELLNKTGAGQKESPEPGPIWFQDHGDPVQFRNLWMVNLADGEVLPSDLNPDFGMFTDGELGAGNSGKMKVRCRRLRFGLFPRLN
ncbi:MAG: DUF1080 domain-containing protein, partial [Planctomycetota bacterium]|nr:DUF1080 domain-containing protein [Planctomycetota bacterium]